MSDPLKKCHFVEKTGSYVSPRGRMVFVALDKKFKNKKSKRQDDEGEYAVQMLFPPDVDLSLFAKAVNDKVNGRKGFNKPFNKCDDEEFSVRGLEGVDLTGWISIRANTYRARPDVRKRDGAKVDVENIRDEAYAGRWARMSVVPHEYAAQDGGKPGVKFYLNNVQLLDDDEKISSGGGSASADDEFDAIGDAGGGDAGSMFD